MKATWRLPKNAPLPQNTNDIAELQAAEASPKMPSKSPADLRASCPNSKGRSNTKGHSRKEVRAFHDLEMVLTSSERQTACTTNLLRSVPTELNKN